MHAAGLDKLTPEELARLEALVRNYKAPAPAPSTPGTPAVAAAPATAPAAAATPAKAVPPAKVVPSWVGALITLERTGKQADKSDALESRLVGDFHGWSGRATFRLENGQVWMQANNDSYAYTPPLPAPKVKIYPASFGTYWLEIDGVTQRCRVKPVQLE